MSISADFISELRHHFSGDIRLDVATRVLYSTDASLYQIEPLGVVIPRTQDDLHAVVELAAKYSLPILPRGSGSSLAGQAIGEALILDCSRFLDHIVEINPEEQTAIVEPGVVLSTLNRAAAKFGLGFGPDPASAERATMGGVIGNNATGAHSILYGMTADHIVSADVILADGSLATFSELSLERAGQIAVDGRSISENFIPDKSIVSAPLEASIYSASLHIREKYADAIKTNYPRSWRNSAGYRLNYLLPWSASRPPQWIGDEYPSQNIHSSSINLSALLAGSEGTLAVIRRARVNLVSKPKFTILGVLAYESIAAACDDVPELLKRQPSAVELIPQMLVHLARSVPAYAAQLAWVIGDPAALIIVEFSGDNADIIKEKVRNLRTDVLIAETAADQAKVWGVRKVGLGIFDSRPSSARPVAFIEDCAIPVENLGSFVRELEKILAAQNTEAAFYGHASAGCLHVRPIINLKTAQGVSSLRAISEQVMELSRRLDGAMSSEHGDGIVRSEWLQPTYGDQVVEAMRLLKHSADPQSILNPKNMFGAPPMDTNLRYGTDYHSAAWIPFLDFEHNGGLAGAIEQCNGAGVCRKADGVMCPSFQATREEQNSTRGRANLLRDLIKQPAHGVNPASKVDDRAVFEAMGLCLACKGCKAECPSGVDMAKLKYEFQHEYYKSHRRPLHDYLFGYINQLAPLGAPLGKMFNWGMQNPLTKKLSSYVFGISEKRALPKFGQMRKRAPMTANQKFIESCIFLPDTFSHYFEPKIEWSFFEVLAACDIDVKVLPLFGAGRTLVSKGFIEAARRQAERVLDAIFALDPSGKLPVIGIEPSEIYSLRDEYYDLLPQRHAEVEALSQRTFLVDEYLVRMAAGMSEKRISHAVGKDPERQIQNPKTMLHGHCYQKAQPPAADGFATGQMASAELLRSVGYDVEIIPSGCCGMAGAFGYENEHYDVSIKVGEQVLFPTIRNAAGAALVAAPGTSCRSQIADGTGVEADHPLVLTAIALGLI